MDIIISPTSEDPIYKQIFDQIRAQIIQGDLPSGYCLPPIRTVALELRISVITVKRAWEELEHAGLIYTMAGKGCFVAPLPQQALEEKRNRVVVERMRKDAAFYKSLGLTLDEAIDLLRQAYKD